MEEVTLVADVGRPVGKSAARKIRREGKVPAIVYGQGTDPEPVAVPGRDLQHILGGAGGANTLINLDLSGRSELVLARQVVRHPVRHNLVHLDFIRVRRDQAVSAEVPIHLVGEAQGTKDGGLVEQDTFSLSIEAMPGDLPASIEADISALGIGDQLSVADLKLPAGVATTQDPGDLVAHVSAPKGLDLPEEGEAAEGEAAEGEGEGGEASAEAGEGASAEAE
ncbi:MAG TPA: 50S ribosomal protein L25 [Acidimicrobiia bacterium]|jgi:large subunit ribosomal protein L25|nr:50S ribosomal protein L25 [Acidimicrobiia bacterium]